MKHFTNIHELVGHTKQKIDQLHVIVDTLLMDYRNGAEMISEKDLRQKPLEELQMLNDNISELVDTHPAMHVNKMVNGAVTTITKIAMKDRGVKF